MASPLRRPRVTWMACEFAALDLMQHGLAGAAERAGGVGEREIAVGDVGHEARADVVGEPDPPGRGGRGLLAGEQAVAQPAADGEHATTPSSVGGLVDRHEFCESGSGGGAAGMPARWRAERTRLAVNGRPVPVRRPLRVRIAAICSSG